jgi:hypothetical protein
MRLRYDDLRRIPQVNIANISLQCVSIWYSFGHHCSLQCITNSLGAFVNYGSTPALDKIPLKRCESDCDNDGECSDGLICKQNDALEEVPGCSGSQTSGTDYCIDPSDWTHGTVFMPTGGWNDDWLYTEGLKVALVAGNNVIRAQIPLEGGYKAGPNIDHLVVEGQKISSSFSFRNPPHFMSKLDCTMLPRDVIC